MSTLSTHVLDISRGRPAANLFVKLERQSSEGSWTELGQARTNADGRAPALLASRTALEAATYRLTFDTASYFGEQNLQGFYPYVQVVFALSGTDHFHVPLLLSPFGYSTYRGS